MESSSQLVEDMVRDAVASLRSAKHEIQIEKAGRKHVLMRLQEALEHIVKAYGVSLNRSLPRVHDLQELTKYVSEFDQEVARKISRLVILDQVAGAKRFRDTYDEKKTGKESLPSLYTRVERVFLFIAEKIPNLSLGEPISRQACSPRETESSFIYNGKNVSLKAILPEYADKLGGSCSIKFHHIMMEGVSISLRPDEIINCLFRGLKTAADSGKRAFVVKKIGKGYLVQISKCSLVLDQSQMRELCKIVDHFAEVFVNRLLALQDFLGIREFSLIRPSHVEVIRVPKRLWRLILEYTKHHDIDAKTKDSIYDSRSNSLMVYPLPRGDRHYIDGSFHLSVDWTMDTSDEVSILWSFTHSVSENLANLNEYFWNCEKIYAWFVAHLLPNVACWEAKKSNEVMRFFRGDVVQSFVNTFNLHKCLIKGEVLKELPSSKGSRSIDRIIDKASDLQIFFNVPSFNELPKRDVIDLLQVLETCIASTSGGDGDFWIYVNRAFRCSCEETVAESVRYYAEVYLKNKTVVGHLDVDLLFRSICFLLESDYICLSEEAVESIESVFKRIDVFVEREKVMEKFFNFFYGSLEMSLAYK